MEDDEIAFQNLCADLVSLKRNESFPLHLLGTKPAGVWVCVHEFCQQIGVTVDAKPELFVTWLPDPMADDDYVVIHFYDDASKRSMAAHYNRARLTRNPP